MIYTKQTSAKQTGKKSNFEIKNTRLERLGLIEMQTKMGPKTQNEHVMLYYVNHRSIKLIDVGPISKKFAC